MKAGPYLEYLGSAGEHRVISELLLRGINTFVSKLDHGIDFILQNGKTIQVKTSRKHYNKINNSHYYHFTWGGWFKLKNGEKRKKYSIPCDFYIFWCIEDNTFYVIPSTKLKERYYVDLFPNSQGASPFRKSTFARDRSRWNIYKEKWSLLNSAFDIIDVKHGKSLWSKQSKTNFKS